MASRDASTCPRATQVSDRLAPVHDPFGSSIINRVNGVHQRLRTPTPVIGGVSCTGEVLGVDRRVPPEFLPTQTGDGFRGLLRGNVATEIGYGIPSLQTLKPFDCSGGLAAFSFFLDTLLSRKSSFVNA